MEEHLEAQVAAADARARNGRVSRLKVLMNGMPEERYPVPALAHQYFEEARLCWYLGAFVATLLMVQLAFEELLRSFYRTARGVGGKLDSGILVDQAGFAQLIREARGDRFLSDSEADALASLKACRNPYVHTKDTGSKGPTWLDQLMKITAPEIVDVGVEDEAHKAVALLTGLLPVLCMRM